MNNREKLAAIAFLTASIVLSQGCMKSLCRVSDIRNDMNDFSRKLDGIVTSVDRFRNDQWEGYRYLSRQMEDTTRGPFPQMFSSLRKLGVAADKLKTYSPALIDLRCEFEDFAGDKGIIESGTPEWDTLAPIKAKYSSLVNQFNDLAAEADGIKEEVKKDEAEGILYNTKYMEQ